MLALPHTNSWGFVYSNQTDGSLVPGISVTPGASSVEGSFTEIAADASITTEIQYVALWVNSGRSSTASKLHFLDFAWDPTGGTTYDQILFQDLACGNSAGVNNEGLGRFYHFPCKIPAGSAIAVRIQGSNATAGTVRVEGKFYGKPSRPELWRPAAYAETLGAGASTLGVSFTPGTTAWGSWASLGTTTKKHFWAQLGVQIDNGTFDGDNVRLQLAIGDGTNQHIIIDQMIVQNTFEAISSGLQQPCTWEIPAGAELWVRGNCNNAPVTGYNATCVLFGG